MRSLVQRDGPSLDLAYNADDHQMASLLRAMQARFGAVSVCETADEVFACAPESAIVLRPREDQLEALNAGRPKFERLRLRTVLWCTRAMWRVIRAKAPDLYDWHSRAVEVPSEPPSWAIESLVACERAESNCLWTGPSLDECVRRAWPGRAVQRLDARTDYSSLLAQIDEGASAFLAFEHVHSERELWRVRWALAEKKRRTGAALVDVGDGVRSSGWWRLHATPMDWDQAVERLRAAADPTPALTAALCGLKPERVASRAEMPESNGVVSDRSEMELVEAELFAGQSSTRLLARWYALGSARMWSDIAEHAASLLGDRDTAAVVWLLAEGAFERARAIVSSHPCSRDKGSLEHGLLMQAELGLGRYAVVIEHADHDSNEYYSALARSFDARAREALEHARATDNKRDGALELAIALGVPLARYEFNDHLLWLWLEGVAVAVVASNTVGEIAGWWQNSISAIRRYDDGLIALSVARALLRHSQAQPALRWAVAAREFFSSRLGPSHHFTGRALLAEGRALFADGQWARARDTFALAVAALEASVGADHPDTHEARFEHQWTRRFLREEDTTETLRAEFAAIIQRVPETHPRLASLRDRIELPAAAPFVPLAPE